MTLKPRLHDTTGCQTGCTTGCQWQPAVSCKQTSNRLSSRLSNGFDNRFDNRVEWTTVRSTGCQTGLYNRLDNRMYTRYSRFVKAVVKRVWQPVECLYTGYNRLYRVNGASMMMSSDHQSLTRHRYNGNGRECVDDCMMKPDILLILYSDCRIRDRSLLIGCYGYNHA